VAEGKVTNRDGELVAQGEGKFFRTTGDMEKLLAQELE
jgi:hypothetical protein